MPKRPSTPPPGDDEPKYLTVLYPYPPEVNMEIRGEVIALARWLACCMGRYQDLYAVFHKPSTSNMVLIEVNRHYTDFRKLLGAHKWSDFVLKPGAHRDKVTRIYFSTLANVRAVEKAGWKRIFIYDDWFKDFIPNNQYIAYPYPASTYCDPPTEDHTTYKLCRPIPVTLFEIRVPTTPPPAPVGSSTWIAQKEAGTVARKLYASASTLLPRAEPRRRQIVITSPPTMSAVASLSSTINGPLGYNDVDVENSESSESTVCLSGYHQNGSSLTEDFGTLIVNPTTATAKEPLCITHQIVCKEKVCCDYRKQLQRMKRKKNSQPMVVACVGKAGHSPLAVFNRGRGRGTGDGRGGGGRGGRGGAAHPNHATPANNSPQAATRGRGTHFPARGSPFPARGHPSVPRGNAWTRGPPKYPVW